MSDSGRTMILTYRYRLLPTKRQHQALVAILESQRELYNAALLERIDCYRKTGLRRTFIDQCKALTEWRGLEESAAAQPLKLQRWTLKRVDQAFEAFFRRCKAKDSRAGFPRFRGEGWWKTFGFREFAGIRLDGKRLRWSGMPGGLRIHLHRSLPAGTPLSCSFTRDGGGWHVSLQMRVAASEARGQTTAVGVDVGLSNLAALSTGEMLPNHRHAKRAERELRRRLRALSRCQRGSKRRAKVRQKARRLHLKIASTRATYLHQVSADLVGRFDLIAVEKLNIKGLARGMLAKPVRDASWGMLRQYLAYKAEKAGARLVEVDPRYTSQTCPECGQVAAKDLKQRVHECDCGCVLDRDVAAARVILHRAVAGPGAGNVAGCGVRSLGNTSTAVVAERRYQRSERRMALGQ